MSMSGTAIDLPGIIGDPERAEYAQLLSELRATSLGADGGRYASYRVDCGAGPEDMTAGRVLANLALLFPYRVAGRPPAAGRFERGRLDVHSIAAHMDATIAELHGALEPDDLSRAVAEAAGFLSDLGCWVTSRVGTSISIKSLLEAAERDPEVGRLLRWRLPPGELGEIERAADAAATDLVARLAALPGDFGRLLGCGAAINQNQLRQALVSVGVKPGLGPGELLPEPIDASFLGGLRGCEDMYVCAIGARKALANEQQVKISGYLARKLVLLVAGHSIDPALPDCGTTHGLRLAVQNEWHAQRIAGRRISAGAGQPFRLHSAGELSALVGTEVAMRSPVTCGGRAGVCHACYGELARRNARIHAGIYGTLVVSHQITQRLLATKHLLKAHPIQITWPEEFHRHFTVERATIIADSGVDRVYIRLEHLGDNEDEDEEGQRTASVFSYRLAGVRGRHIVTLPVGLCLDEDAWSLAETEGGELILHPLPETTVFHVPIANTDQSALLKAIGKTIENSDAPDVTELYARLIEMLHLYDLDTPSIHTEMILRAMVRSATDPTQRPDYSGAEPPEYVLLRLNKAIFMSPSLTNTLAFQNIKAQLTGTEILLRSEPGLLDALFSS